MGLRFVSVFLVAFLSAQNATSQTGDLIDLEFGTFEHFDVATWNIEWFPKNGETTIEYVVEIIEELELDVIAIQEIDQPEEFEYLLSLLQGYDGFYQEGEYARLGFIYNIQSVEVNDHYEIFDNGTYGNPFPRPPLIMELTFMEEHQFTVINNHFKCCGDSFLDEDDAWDEESRRAYASELLKDYMDFHFSEDRLIMLGDLNDLLTDSEANNVFQVYLDDEANYRFADMEIATGSSSQWSFPNWPSHLDHILISDDLFGALESPSSTVATIQIDDFFPGGLNGYDNNVSDHLPVGFSFDPEIAPLRTGEMALENDLIVFPNPSQGQVKIRMASGLLISSVELCDMTGRALGGFSHHTSGTEVRMDLSDLPQGVYSVTVFTKDGKSVNKKLLLTGSN